MYEDILSYAARKGFVNTMADATALIRFAPSALLHSVINVGWILSSELLTTSQFKGEAGRSPNDRPTECGIIRSSHTRHRAPRISTTYGEASIALKVAHCHHRLFLWRPLTPPSPPISLLGSSSMATTIPVPFLIEAVTQACVDPLIVKGVFADATITTEP